jgi:anti-sigma factor RsiW
MNCEEAQNLIHGYLDAELDLANTFQIERHLAECSICAPSYRNLQKLRDMIRKDACYFEPPASLANRIQSFVRKAGLPLSPTRSFPWRVVAIAACFALVVITGWSLLRSWSVPSPEDFLIQELIAGHVRSQMVENHRVDVASAKQHTVKPWFDGKVDFSPTVKDLEKEEFLLIGGRLDYLANRPVAALVYQRRKHFINLFVWPSTAGTESSVKAQTRQGFHLVHWIQSGMAYWAVSDLNEKELLEFAALFQNGS